MEAEDRFIIKRLANLPMPMVVLVSLVSMIGVVMLYSAAQGSLEPWAGRHFTRFLVGFICMITVATIDIRFWFRNAYIIYVFALAFLAMVEVMGFIGMGAQRWVNIAGVNFQPSEIMKIAVVLALARYFHSLHLNNIQKLSILVIPGILVIVPVVLILKQPNLGTAVVTAMVAVAIFFMSGINIRKFVIAGIAGGACLPVIWNYMHDYQKKRVLTFLDPEADPLGAGYNIIQSKIAIGSGGIFGKGFLQGSQSQLSFLPEKQTDFIFTMLTEEFGLIGGLGIIIIYASIIILGIRIAVQCDSHFGKLAAFGIVTAMFMHVFINMAMSMGMIPVVGVPLPLLSYGGSNLIATLIGIGFVLNAHVHRETHVERALT